VYYSSICTSCTNCFYWLCVLVLVEGSVSSSTDEFGLRNEQKSDSSQMPTVSSGAGDMTPVGSMTLTIYKVNFGPAIYEMINEVKYLDRLGFKVPVLARNVAMMEDVYMLNVSELNMMLKRYYSTVALLDEVQVIVSYSVYGALSLVQL